MDEFHASGLDPIPSPADGRRSAGPYAAEDVPTERSGKGMAWFVEFAAVAEAAVLECGLDDDVADSGAEVEEHLGLGEICELEEMSEENRPELAVCIAEVTLLSAVGLCYTSDCGTDLFVVCPFEYFEELDHKLISMKSWTSV